jgi:hypothetical protein
MPQLRGNEPILGLNITLQSFTGATSAHIFSYSVVVIMYLALVLFASGLIGPIKYISHLSNAWSVTYGLNGISSLLLGCLTFERHCIFESTPSSLCESLATIVLRAIPSVR